MGVPLEGVYFKSQLQGLGKIKYGRSYIINLESEVGEDGKENSGSHLRAFQANKLLSGKIQALIWTRMAWLDRK